MKTKYHNGYYTAIETKNTKTFQIGMHINLQNVKLQVVEGNMHNELDLTSTEFGALKLLIRKLNDEKSDKANGIILNPLIIHSLELDDSYLEIRTDDEISEILIYIENTNGDKYEDVFTPKEIGLFTQLFFTVRDDLTIELKKFEDVLF